MILGRDGHAMSDKLDRNPAINEVLIKLRDAMREGEHHEWGYVQLDRIPRRGDRWGNWGCRFVPTSDLTLGAAGASIGG